MSNPVYGSTVLPLEQRGRPDTPDRNNHTWNSLDTFEFQRRQNVERGSVTLHASLGTARPNPNFEYRAYTDAAGFIYKGTDHRDD